MNENDLKYWLGISTYLILAQGERTMAAIDDLNNAIATLQTNVTALDARVAALGTGNEAAVEAAAVSVQGVADHIATLAQ